jgi:hypothetical protein
MQELHAPAVRVSHFPRGDTSASTVCLPLLSTTTTPHAHHRTHARSARSALIVCTAPNLAIVHSVVSVRPALEPHRVHRATDRARLQTQKDQSAYFALSVNSPVMTDLAVWIARATLFRPLASSVSTATHRTWSFPRVMPRSVAPPAGSAKGLQFQSIPRVHCVRD